MFVQAVDSRFYRNPRLCGSDWWAEFADIRIIIRKFSRSTQESCRRRASKVLREYGVKFTTLDFMFEQKEAFPPDWDKLQDSYSFAFVLRGPIPIPPIYDLVVNNPTPDSQMIGFESEVSSLDCVKAVVGMDIDLGIARALLAEPFYKGKQERVRPEICKKLYVQFPWLRSIDRNNMSEKLASQPETVTLKWRR